MSHLKNTIVLVNDRKIADALNAVLKQRNQFEVRESPQGSPTLFERHPENGVFGFCEVQSVDDLPQQMTWIYRELGVQNIVLTGIAQSVAPSPFELTALIPDLCVRPVVGSKIPGTLVLFEEFFFDTDLQHELRSMIKSYNHGGQIKLLSTGHTLSTSALDWTTSQLSVPFAEFLSGAAFKSASSTGQKIGAVFTHNSSAGIKSLVQSWLDGLGWSF